MARLPELEGMTVKELRGLKEKIDIAIVEREKTERADLRIKMEALAAASGLTLDDVLGSRRGKGSRGQVAVKYRNPENPAETWTGRGRKPNWLSEKLSRRGVKIEDFAV
jgi:DNA-binding protein H-NS